MKVNLKSAIKVLERKIGCTEFLEHDEPWPIVEFSTNESIHWHYRNLSAKMFYG